MVTTEITIEELRVKFKDQDDRYNNWYFTCAFTNEGINYKLKVSITEGTLLGQQSFLSLSHDPLKIIDEEDTQVIKKPPNDINFVIDEDDVTYTELDDQYIVEMGDLKAVCKTNERRLICKNEKIKLDLVYKPRGPIFYWGKEKGALCVVTEETRVAGIESLSDVTGSVIVNGKRMEIEGNGLFERVWFGELNFFQIRVMNWFYANFETLYTYACITESVNNECAPFHFETGKLFIKETKEYLFAEKSEITPESWIFFEEARRFIPWEQSVKIKTDKGILKLKVIPTHYPQLIQPPTRLFAFEVDNIPGWSSLFYDLPVKFEGKFEYIDGKIIELKNGKGMNEIIRIVPL
jgi:hypothetical protein